MERPCEVHPAVAGIPGQATRLPVPPLSWHQLARPSTIDIMADQFPLQKSPNHMPDGRICAPEERVLVLEHNL